jgi:hypothetical protein
VGALGADRGGQAGAHPGQVVSAIVAACGVDGRVRVVLTWCEAGGYGRVGRESPPPVVEGFGRAKGNNAPRRKR